MKIMIEQSELSRALNIVLKAISTRTTIDILKSVFLSAHDDKLTLIGNDLNIGIETTINANVIEPGKIVIDGKIFNDIIRKLPNETITLSQVNDTVNIDCLNSSFNLKSNDPAKFPELPIVNPDDRILVDKFILADMIRQTIFATSHDENRPILTGVLFDIQHSNMTMVAIDLYRIALKNININSDKNHHLVVPAKALNELLKVITSDVNESQIAIYITEKYIKFSIDKVVLIARLLEGEFVNYQQIIPNEYKLKIKCSRSELFHAIDRASLITTPGKNTSLLFNVEDDYLIISSQTEKGSVNEKIKIDLEGPNLKIGFNPKYWLDVLKVIEEDNIYIEMTTNISPCIIKPEENDHYTYLLLPIRIMN